MEKLVRRIATTGASLAIAGGALFAAGGSATAAALPAAAPVPARAGVVAEAGNTGWNHGGYDGDRSGGHHHHWRPFDGYICGRFADDRFYPWIWDQLRVFGYVL